MNLPADIFSVLAAHWQLLLGTLLVIVLGQMLLWTLLNAAFGERLDPGERYTLSLAGWMIPLALASGLWLASSLIQLPIPAIVWMLGCAALLAFGLLRTEAFRVAGTRGMVWMLVALLILFVLLRLAFLSQALIASYFDSAQHYQIIKNLTRELTSHDSSPFQWPAGGYYHIGFHLVAAWIAASFRADFMSVLLLLGQMILVIIPFAVFPLVRHETGSGVAGMFAVLLASVGWYMPAYAVNWGKYPALTSLPLICFVTTLAYLSFRYRTRLTRRTFAWLMALLAISSLVTALTHSRSLVMFAILGLSWVLAAGWQASRLPEAARWLLLGAVVAGIVWEIRVIQAQDVFGPLFDPYWNRGRFVTSLVLILAFFAVKAFSRLAVASILLILLLLGALFIPVTVPGYGNLTLLDRPFVEMILYLPLSILGGAGAAGAAQTVRAWMERRQARRFLSGRWIPLLLTAVVLIHAAREYTFYPSDCCDIVGRDDLVALDWIDRNVPPEAHILISSTELRVLATDSFQGAVSGDAGAWITPLTDRRTFFLPYHFDLSQPTTFDTICQMQADYIFVGEEGAAFNNDQLAGRPEWYRIILSMPETKLYQVVGCT